MRITAIVSIFILLGPIGGLIAFIGSAQRPLVSKYKPFCPDCGEEKVKAFLDNLDRKTGEMLGSNFQLWLYTIFYILMAAMVFWLAWGLNIEFLEWGGLTGAGPAIIFVFGGLAMLWTGLSKTLNFFQADRETLIKLVCKGCKKTRFLRDDGTMYSKPSSA